MFKRTLIGVLMSAGVFSVSIAPASALTVGEIQAQIQSLLARVNELTKQLNALRVQEQADLPAEPAAPDQLPVHRICKLLARNLARGAQGDDVVSLQEFLRENGHLSAEATGYFGDLTAQGVARWQAAEGIEAAGIIGPLSRERLKIWCGGGSTLGATPLRGEAPLTVTFSPSIKRFGSAEAVYRIDFGDGIAADYLGSPIHHVYNANGTYVAKLEARGFGTAEMVAQFPWRTLGVATIHVGPVACTKEYKPVCGSKPIVCITTPCNPIPATYGNRCMMTADGASFLYEGQCRESVNKPPTISSFTGPTTLGVNQSGTWAIDASDPENGQLSYSIWWGDEYVSGASAKNASDLQGEFEQTTTYTHSYEYAGTYTISITVRDSEGAKAKMTSTVRVRGGSATCLDNGVSYEEGARLSCLHKSDAAKTCIVDADYVCRSGAWKIEGSAPVACTADAYQCPNGQWVGRTGPHCTFVCPSAQPTSYTTTVESAHNCPAGYGWCPAGPAGYSCTLLTEGFCPSSL